MNERSIRRSITELKRILNNRFGVVAYPEPYYPAG